MIPFVKPDFSPVMPFVWSHFLLFWKPFQKRTKACIRVHAIFMLILSPTDQCSLCIFILPKCLFSQDKLSKIITMFFCISINKYLFESIYIYFCCRYIYTCRRICRYINICRHICGYINICRHICRYMWICADISADIWVCLFVHYFCVHVHVQVILLSTSLPF